MNVTKTTRYLTHAGAATLGAGVPLRAGASVAVATESRFTPQSILNSAGTTGDTQFTQVNGEWINTRVTGIAGWILGVAIALFVLRVILTAVDRMVLGGDDPYRPPNSGLTAIPLIGAYPSKDANGNGYSWKDVWISFGKNLAICIGAWVLVNEMVGLVSWFMTSGIGSENAAS